MRMLEVLILLWIPLAIADPDAPHLPIQPAVKPADRHTDLIAATNRIFQVLNSSPAPEVQSLTGAIDAGCIAITKLLADKLFHEEYEFVIGPSFISIARRVSTQSNLALFKSDFIDIEEQWLLESGLQSLVTQKILKLMPRLKKYFYLDPGSFDFNGYVSKLKSELCDGSQRLQTIKSVSKRRAIVDEWGVKLGGVSVVAVDVSSALYYPEASTFEISSDPTIGKQRHVVHGSITMGVIISNWGKKAPPPLSHPSTH